MPLPVVWSPTPNRLVAAPLRACDQPPRQRVPSARIKLPVRVSVGRHGLVYRVILQYGVGRGAFPGHIPHPTLVRWLARALLSHRLAPVR